MLGAGHRPAEAGSLKPLGLLLMSIPVEEQRKRTNTICRFKENEGWHILSDLAQIYSFHLFLNNHILYLELASTFTTLLVLVILAHSSVFQSSAFQTLLIVVYSKTYILQYM